MGSEVLKVSLNGCLVSDKAGMRVFWMIYSQTKAFKTTDLGVKMGNTH